jgi:hypothetical protein
MGRRFRAPQNRLWLGAGVFSVDSDRFQVPRTAARYGRWLAVVNARFDTGRPPTADQYEVVLVNE